MKKRVAYTFTGQGSQRVGMWDGLSQSPRASSLFKQVDRTLGIDLSRICQEGPIENLTKTSNTQPAIVAYSLALLSITRELHPNLPLPTFCLGHSVGEFSALAAAEAIDMETAVLLIRQRGLLMERVDGQMVAVLGKEIDEVQKICEQFGTEIANINCPGQVVISGSKKSIDEAVNSIGDPRKAKLLQVSGPFHSSLMAPLQEEWKQILGKVTLRDPVIPVILNMDARPATKAQEIRQKSVEQLTSPVLWHQSIEYAISQGVTIFIEFGSSGILTNLLKRINPTIERIAVTDYQSAQALNF